jgi:tryptophanyl-tRNA synthetase
MISDRVLSGMRPTGGLHLGHYHGVLKNWIRLQERYQCLFFVADWHALTTHYDNPGMIGTHTREMLIDWIAAGVDPDQAVLFVQSQVPAHAELHVLLSMVTPLGWLERVPTYKEQQEKLSEKDLSTYGFLGYPLLQAADILIYRANMVPVGEDQVPHIEFTREIARRFNHLFGRPPGFEAKAEATLKKLGSKPARLCLELRSRYLEKGDAEALSAARALIEEGRSLAAAEREILLGFVEGGGRSVLTEPEALLTEASRMPGLDGQKMSKSYNNTIGLRDHPDTVVKKVRTMPTDPARVRRTDAGDPQRCPVWQLHKVYSDDARRQWVQQGCTSAGIGCIECKQPVIDAILDEQGPMRARAEPFLAQPEMLDRIIATGCEKARALADETMEEVRGAMGLGGA